MTAFNHAILSMESALEAEAKALTTGALQHLSHIEHAKRKAWDTLQITPLDSGGESLLRVQKMAARNAKLLLAAKEGITLARTLRQALSKGPKPLSTYGSNGQKSTVVIERPSEINSRSF